MKCNPGNLRSRPQALARHPLVATGLSRLVLRPTMRGVSASRLFRFVVVSAGLALLIVAMGCRREPDGAAERIAPNPNAPAAYPAVITPPSTNIARARPHLKDTSWKAAPFWVLHTELSPAILVHASTRYLGLFTDLAECGLGAPTHVAWSTRDGPRAQKAGATHDVSAMEENWLVVWFAGAAGWTNWDAPWAVFLQRKPGWLRVDEKGLHLEFPAAAGDVVLLPLYGYFKLPPSGRDYLTEHGLPGRKLRSWQWEKTLARDPLTRLRYWAGATRELPIYCEETFSADRGRDELTIRWRFERHSIEDDWRTRHLKLAPVSPPLSLAVKESAFPVRFSNPFFDMEIPTPLGPYTAVQGEDAFDATFPLLHYVNESAAVNEAGILAQANAQPPSSAVPEKWSTFGRPGLAPLGDETARCAGKARLAYKSGDIDGYNYATYQFVRELTLLWDRQRGAEYFRKQQPWHSMEWMDEEVFVAGLQADGWKLDGPNYPAQAAERLFVTRWNGFADADIARFYRDWLREDVRRELGWTQHRGLATNAAASLARARSLLLGESPKQYARLIPPGAPSPFVAGAEREVSGPNPTLLTEVQLVDQAGRPSTNAWPRLVWPTWKTPAGDTCSFGRIKPARDGKPTSVRRIPLNWNTEVITFGLP